MLLREMETDRMVGVFKYFAMIWAYLGLSINNHMQPYFPNIFFVLYISSRSFRFRLRFQQKTESLHL